MSATAPAATGAPAFWLLSQVKRLSDADMRRLAAAYAVQLARDLAPEWGLLPPTVSVASTLADIPDSGIPVLFDPNLDVPDAVAYHSLTADGRDYCRVQADDTMALAEIEEAGSHELCEDSVDRPCNRWATRTDASGTTFTSYALEACDGLEGTPEEGGSYLIDLGQGDPVRVANFCGRAWFADEPLRGAKIDFLGKCSRPWQLLSPTSSYAVTLSGGATVTLPLGRALAARKVHPAARTARRLRQGLDRQRRSAFVQRLLGRMLRCTSLLLVNRLVDACEDLGEEQLRVLLAAAGRDLADVVDRLDQLDRTKGGARLRSLAPPT
jgi:hypothetical protein